MRINLREKAVNIAHTALRYHYVKMVLTFIFSKREEGTIDEFG